MTRDQVESKINQAHESFQSRKKTSFAERKILMNNLAKLMQDQFEDLAKLDTQEMGMLYKDAK
jgi:succinate-semialdehyde dehydrogenase/glutarate-semialdehyde dehydrogenase